MNTDQNHHDFGVSLYFDTYVNCCIHNTEINIRAKKIIIKHRILFKFGFHVHKNRNESNKMINCRSL